MPTYVLLDEYILLDRSLDAKGLPRAVVHVKSYRGPTIANCPLNIYHFKPFNAYTCSVHIDLA